MNKQTCFLGWVNSLDGTKQVCMIQNILAENATDLKDKSLFSCEEVCRICHCGAEDEELINPCRCSGSTKYAHQSCLLSWFEMKKDKICELCLYEITVKRTGFKPIAQVFVNAYLAPFVLPIDFFLFQFIACLFIGSFLLAWLLDCFLAFLFLCLTD